MKRVDNPPNPYLATHHEWLEEPPPAMPQVYEERAKSILSENDSPDLGFRWSLNPYRGCTHGCHYCFARRYHSQLELNTGDEFASVILVKTNFVEVLRRELDRPTWARDTIGFGTPTDPYQPIEGTYRLSRGVLEALWMRPTRWASSPRAR